MAEIIYGSEIKAKKMRSLKQEIQNIKGRKPTLAVILVGDNPASISYVKAKNNACKEVGINCKQINVNTLISQEELLSIIYNLNQDNDIDGILIQLPLPTHLNQEEIVQAVDYRKDVDGFNYINAGKLLRNQDCFVPCTPLGIMEIIKEMKLSLQDKQVVVVGRSNLVGKPLATLLSNSDATVTLCHSKTHNLQEKCKLADILIVAIGKPKFINKRYLKENACVIDVGISKVDGKLVGDVDFEDVVEVVSKITPVPKGVGPMTVCMLLYNTLKAYKEKL